MFDHRVLIAAGLMACASNVSAQSLSAPSEREARRALAAQAEARRSFTEARSYLSYSELDAWYSILFELEAEFDAICGDTFCEGDFTNYQPLAFRCSVNARSGRVSECTWIFAASNVDVEPSTGSLVVDARTWQCRMPVAAGTPLRTLITALSGSASGPLYAALPGTRATLFDGVADCL